MMNTHPYYFSIKRPKHAARRPRAIRSVFDDGESKVIQEVICSIKSTAWQIVACPSTPRWPSAVPSQRVERIDCYREQ
jgi:hypothetical protein